MNYCLTLLYEKLSVCNPLTICPQHNFQNDEAKKFCFLFLKSRVRKVAFDCHKIITGGQLNLNFLMDVNKNIIFAIKSLI